VIVERPRIKPFSTRKGRRAALDDLPQREGMRRGGALPRRGRLGGFASDIEPNFSEVGFGLDFELRADGTYTDLGGKTTGCVVYLGSSLTFIGGPLTGRVGRDLHYDGFELGSVRCSVVSMRTISRGRRSARGRVAHDVGGVALLIDAALRTERLRRRSKPDMRFELFELGEATRRSDYRGVS
jgi:hypothetical protein